MDFTQKAAKVIPPIVLLVAGVLMLLWNGGSVSENSQEQEILPLPTASITPSLLPTATVAGIQGEEAVVQRVVDGDTIVLQGGMRVRYIGIDTPESVAPGKPVECAGKEAAARNKELVEGKIVRLERDISETDRLGRLLRYVYVGDIFVNKVLVEEGLAHASPYPPDIARQDELFASERAARENGQGVWSEKCRGNIEQTTPKTGCEIKGNISGGEKIYHTPDCSSYARTNIDTAKGERFFCTEEEAVGAGWRKAGNC